MLRFVVIEEHPLCRIISLTNFIHNSLFINNMFVTLLSSTCFEDNSVSNILLMNKELCIKVG